MGLRKTRRAIERQRHFMEKQYERHRRANLRATPGPHGFTVVLDGLKPTYNVGKIFRSADAFGAREVHLVSIDAFNPGPAAGSFKWVPARFHQNITDCFASLRESGYQLYAADPAAEYCLPDLELPENSAFIFGHEEYGLSFDPADYPEIRTFSIPQFGRVESLNVAVAASVVMYEYLRQTGKAGGNKALKAS